MSYDFDTAPAGFGDHVSKWDGMEANCGVSPKDGIAMWVADMDFAAAPCIRSALQAEIDRGYMGYFGDVAPVNDAVAGWMARQHGWRFDPRILRWSHGVVAAFTLTVEAFSEPGDSVIVFSPVYHAFYGRAAKMGREILESPLKVVSGRFEMDLDALEASLTGRERVLVMCSPHNPGGRLWSIEELKAVAAFCAKHDLILLSDEVHMDLTFPGVRHIPTALAAPEAVDRLITITAASKGFNTAGGETAFTVIEDAALRARFDVAHRAWSGSPNRFGMIMVKAAFTDGAEWSAACRAYIADNFALWRDRIGALPGISVMDMQATYLSWVDFTGTGCDADELNRRIAGEARIAVSPGPQFGTGGEGHARFNLALPRAQLIKAMDRLEAAFADLE